MALQALAMYSELTFSDKGDVTVAVSSSSGFLEKFHVDKNNRLLLQRASLPAVTGDYTLSATGNGCVFAQVRGNQPSAFFFLVYSHSQTQYSLLTTQAVLRYNVPPPKRDTSFSLKVTTHSNRECLGHPVTSFEIHISAS